MGSVVVVGSINVDLVVGVERLPVPGETVLGGHFAQHPGGKGANQAVAAARVGAAVTMVAAVGDDSHAEASLAALADDDVDCEPVRRRPGQPTGVALVMVGPRGENQIAVAPGANAQLVLEIDDMARIAAADVMLVSLEIPMATVIAALRAAREAGVTAILNPAPAHALPSELLAIGPIIVPNEHELVVAIGNEDPTAALDELASRSAGPIIVTQGRAGALLADGDRRMRFDGRRAPAEVDATGAGDAFCGVLAAWLSDGQSLDSAIEAANAAGALSVTAAGARAGLTTREALLTFLAQPAA